MNPWSTDCEVDALTTTSSRRFGFRIRASPCFAMSRAEYHHFHCFSAGVKFSAVHDCYWTHASSVDHMNKLCRDQFIALHNHPILEDLAHHLSTFLPADDASDSAQYITRAQRAKLRELLANIPEKGNFNLNMVRESTFFFS